MKQRIWSLVLAVVLLSGVLGGCGNKGPLVKEYGQKPPLEQLIWGMSQEEALQALKLTEDDVTISGRDRLNNMTLEGEMELSGITGKVSLQFIEPEDEDDLDLGLYSVTLSPNEQDMDALAATLNEKLGSQGQKNGETTVWTTGEDKISSLTEETWKDTLKDLVEKDGEIEDKDIFTSVVLSQTTKNEKTKSKVVFFGKAAAYCAALQKQAG